MGDGGEENDSETFLEGVDAAGGSQACGFMSEKFSQN